MFDGAAHIKRTLLQDFDTVAQHLFAQVDAAIESTHTQSFQVLRQGGGTQFGAVIESEVTHLPNRSGNGDVRQVLTLIESRRRDGCDSSRNDHCFQLCVVGKRALGDEADRYLVLEDVLGGQVAIGGYQAVINNQSAFLPFLLVQPYAAPRKRVFADRGDGSGNDDFLQVLAVAKCLMVNPCESGG